jgi:hypothetical protein
LVRKRAKLHLQDCICSGCSRILLQLQTSHTIIEIMVTKTQLGIAILLGSAILFVFVCPLTVGPPAPLQKQTQVTLFAALAFALSASVLRLIPHMCTVALFGSFPGEERSISDRLALVCTRLC